MRNNKAYDIPTRIFHWLFAAMFLTAFIIGKQVDDESPVFSYHMLIGISLSFLVILRIIWGFIGTKYARFSSFELNPKSLLEYFTQILSGGTKRFLGHNPASSWAAIAMMLFALGLGLTGVLMSSGYKEQLEDFHELLANGFLIISILHIGGVLLHTIRHKEPIALSMIDGNKASVSNSEPITNSKPLVGLLLVILMVGCGAHLWYNYNQQNRTLNMFGYSLQLGENEENEDGDANSSEAGQNENSESKHKDDDGDDD